MIDRDPRDGQLTVTATELRIAVTPWANVVPKWIDSAYIRITRIADGHEVADMTAALSREECLAMSRQFAEIAAQIPAHSAEATVREAA